MSSLTPPPALPSGLLAAIAYFLGRVPLKVRTSIYELVIILGGLATYAILAFPHADSFGVHLPARQAAILTGILTLLAALARSNVFHQILLEAAPAAAPAADPVPSIDSSVTEIGPVADPAQAEPAATDPALLPAPAPVTEQPPAPAPAPPVATGIVPAADPTQIPAPTAAAPVI